MGPADSQKSFLNSKLFWLHLSLILSAILMKWFGPVGKLDGRFFYTISEAKEYLNSLSAIERDRYFWGEIVDYWFMINYSWIFYLIIPKKRVFIPGFLDVIETSMILIFLISGEFYSFHVLLPFVSFPKWLGAATLFLLVAAKLLKKRAKG
jgi:hypothetical protein